MTIEQKAIDFVEDYLRDNLILDAKALVLFTTEIIKDLQKENYIQEQIIIGDQIEHNEEVNRLKQEVKNLRDNYEQYKAAAEPTIRELQEQNEILKRRIARAKSCMKSLIYIAKSEHFNCNGLIKNAEDFIYDRMCPLRKQGQHCITEEPCIMCDRS